jgi:hypothetical protein
MKRQLRQSVDANFSRLATIVIMERQEKAGGGPRKGNIIKTKLNIIKVWQPHVLVALYDAVLPTRTSERIQS